MKSFDLVPKWVPLSGAGSIRLTRYDWAVIRLVDGRRSIRDIVELLKTDIFEVGRIIVNLMTVGVLRLEESAEEQDEALDLVPLRGDALQASEPFELSASEWRLLSLVDGAKSLGTMRDVLNLSAPELLKRVRSLKERAFSGSAERRVPGGGAPDKPLFFFDFRGKLAEHGVEPH